MIGSFHECMAKSCPIGIRLHRKMCSKHWRLVPAEIKKAIATSHGDDLADAELDAIEAVAAVEEAA